MAFKRKSIVVSAVLTLLVAQTQLLWSQEDPSRPLEKEMAKRLATEFLRVERDDDDEPKTLQTSIVRYAPASGEGELVVDLIGVVHIGDKSYYDELNKRFEDYDVVLYEPVAPKDEAIPRRDRGTPVSR